MRTSRIIPAGILSMLVAFNLLTTVRAEDDLWKTDFEAAKAKAKAEKKFLLVDFTGSDWCGFCIKLRDEVFTKDAFKNEAPKQFVLVELDFPHEKKLPDELKAQNDKLGKQYKINGYPTICLMDPEGQVMARIVGYAPGGPEKYLERLADLQKVWESVVQLKAQLAGVQGLDRAKLLDQLVDAYENKLSNPIDELKTWGEEIVALDVDNKAGLKNKYLCRNILAEAEKLANQGKFADAVAELEKAIVLEGLANGQKQDILLKQGMLQFQLKNFAAALAAMKKAEEADPKSDSVAMIKSRIAMFTTVIDSQASMAKDMEGLEKSEGIDRAKLLDKLIQANTKLQMYGAAKATPAEVAKWTQEIIDLDSDNAAGLKNKYEFNKSLNDANALAREKKFDEGLAAIDKALAIAGVAPEQLQEGWMAKGTNYLMQKNFEKALESFNKGLEVAPQGPRSGVLKYYVQMVEQQQKKAAEQKKD